MFISCKYSMFISCNYNMFIACKHKYFMYHVNIICYTSCVYTMFIACVYTSFTLLVSTSTEACFQSTPWSPDISHIYSQKPVPPVYTLNVPAIYNSDIDI